jgi:2-haloacid dehalogenase
LYYKITMIQTNKPEFELVTFDCYGTLVDWEGGAGSFLYRLALAKGETHPPPGTELRRRWEELQFALVTEGPYQPYRDLLGESLRLFGRERGWEMQPADGAALVEALGSWQPFVDTAPALRAVRESGVRLAIISNTDRAIITHTLRQLGVEFDAVVTAEDARGYKPAPELFELARERLRVDPARHLHVAFGVKYDERPARELGWRLAWVNRHVDPVDDGRFDYVWRDLWGLAETARGGRVA